MKKFKFINKFVAVVLFIMSSVTIFLVGCDNSEDDNLFNGFRYNKLYDGTYQITGYEGTQTQITVPSYIDGIIVTKIGKEAFKYCTSITNLYIPETIKSIGTSSLKGCTSLKSLTVPYTVNLARLFYYSVGPNYDTKDIPPSLQELTLLDTCTKISTESFTNCTSLKKIFIPASVVIIEDGSDRVIVGVNGNPSRSNVTLRPFYGCSPELEIYCEYKNAPIGWETYWNYIDKTTPLNVHWGRSSL